MDGFNYWLLCIQQYPPIFLAGGQSVFDPSLQVEYVDDLWAIQHKFYFSPLIFLNAFIWITVFKGWRKKKERKRKPKQQQRRKEQLCLSTVFISPPLREVQPYSALSCKHENDPHQLYHSQLKKEHNECFYFK